MQRNLSTRITRGTQQNELPAQGISPPKTEIAPAGVREAVLEGTSTGQMPALLGCRVPGLITWENRPTPTSEDLVVKIPVSKPQRQQNNHEGTDYWSVGQLVI